MTVFCKACKEKKDESLFLKYTNSSGSGIRKICKECYLKQCKEYYEKNSARIKARVRARNVKLKFGLSIEEYTSMLADQKGVCLICKSPPKKNRLAIDHCHKTNKIRGLLCYFCNIGVGLFRDNPQILRMAAKYLENNSSHSVQNALNV